VLDCAEQPWRRGRELGMECRFDARSPGQAAEALWFAIRYPTEAA
jgi:hypothetical protein